MRKSIISQKIELVVVYTRSQIWVKVVKERGSHRVFLVMKEEFWDEGRKLYRETSTTQKVWKSHLFAVSSWNEMNIYYFKSQIVRIDFKDDSSWGKGGKWRWWRRVDLKPLGKRFLSKNIRFYYEDRTSIDRWLNIRILEYY